MCTYSEIIVLPLLSMYGQTLDYFYFSTLLKLGQFRQVRWMGGIDTSATPVATYTNATRLSA